MLTSSPTNNLEFMLTSPPTNNLEFMLTSPPTLNIPETFKEASIKAAPLNKEFPEQSNETFPLAPIGT